MTAHLRLLGRDLVVPVTGTVTIGRLDDNTVTLDDRAVSRHHAQVTQVEATNLVEDTGSSNGTYLERGDQKWKVAAATALEDGDVIQVGPFRLRYETTSRESEKDAGTTFVPGETLAGLVLPRARNRP